MYLNISLIKEFLAHIENLYRHHACFAGKGCCVIAHECLRPTAQLFLSLMGQLELSLSYLNHLHGDPCQLLDLVNDFKAFIQKVCA